MDKISYFDYLLKSLVLSSLSSTIFSDLVSSYGKN